MIPVIIAGAKALAASPAVGSIASFVARKALDHVATSAVQKVFSVENKPKMSLSSWKEKLKGKLIDVAKDKSPEFRRKRFD